MRDGNSFDPRPMRIELATSEIEGGEFQSWADPAQVVACVYAADPPDTFARFLEPRLTGLEPSFGVDPDQEEARLPKRVASLLERLRQVHARLWRENRSVMRDRRLMSLVATMVEGNRVYFIKGMACWIFRIRQGRATPEWMGADPSRAGTVTTALGGAERLQLEITSLEVEPDDLLVLLAAGTGGAPDRRAVAQIFAQTSDLKRACDGLVNLLGMQSSGAGAVALKFVTVGGGMERQVSGADLFAELGETWDRAPNRPVAGAPPARGTAAEPGLDSEALEMRLPRFLEEAGRQEGPAAEDEGDRPAARAPLPGFRFPWEQDPREETESPGGAGPEDRSLQATEPAGGEPPAVRLGCGRPARARPGGVWAVSFGIVLALLLAVLAIPWALRLGRPAGEGVAGGILRIDPTPPARAVFIDGVDMGTGTPAILEGIEAGERVVRLDLGTFGVIERRVVVRDGESVDIQPQATGSLEISAVVSRPGAVAWVGGQTPRPVPCRFDSLSVGWQNIFYEDDELPLWQREVLIRAGEEQKLRVANAIASGRSLLRIEAWQFREGEGLVEEPGDSLLLDGRPVGVTPWEQEVAPGLHGVRILGRNGQAWTEVVQLAAGATRVVAPRFGMDRWPRIEHQEPGRLLLRGQLLLTATIETPDGTPPRNPRLHLPGLDASVREIPLSPIDAEAGIYVAVIDPERVPRDHPVEYYFTVQTRSGAVLCSELYRFTAVSDVSLGVEGRPVSPPRRSESASPEPTPASALFRPAGSAP